jgi:hypothetical protein
MNLLHFELNSSDLPATRDNSVRIASSGEIRIIVEDQFQILTKDCM